MESLINRVIIREPFVINEEEVNDEKDLFEKALGGYAREIDPEAVSDYFAVRKRKKTIKIIVPSSTQLVGRIRRAIKDLLEDNQRDDVLLAVSEVLTNAVLRGEKIGFAIWRRNKSCKKIVIVNLSLDCKPIELYQEHPDPLCLPEHGQGMCLVRQVSHVEYVRFVNKERLIGNKIVLRNFGESMVTGLE
jgi:hypothetical protein